MTAINTKISERYARNPAASQLRCILNLYIKELEEPHSHFDEDKTLILSMIFPFEISRMIGSWNVKLYFNLINRFPVLQDLVQDALSHVQAVIGASRA